MKRWPRLLVITFLMSLALPSMPVQSVQATPRPDPWLECSDSREMNNIEQCLDESFEQAARVRQTLSYQLALEIPFGFTFMTATLRRLETGGSLPPAQLAVIHSPHYLTVRVDADNQIRSAVWRAPTSAGPLHGYYWRGLRDGQLTTVVNEYSIGYRLTVTLTSMDAGVLYAVSLRAPIHNDLCVVTLTGEAASDFAAIGSSIVCDPLPDSWMTGELWR